MIMGKKVFLFFVTVMFVVGCSTRQQIIDLSKVKVYNIEPERGQFFQWDDLIDTVAIIKLETTDKSLIGRFNKGIVDKNNVYIFDFWYKNLFQFDITGKFVQTIGTMGQGPGEYSEARDICVSASNIYILDYAKIHSYSRETGAYIESWTLPDESIFNPVHFFVYDKDSYFLWASNPDGYDTPDKYYRMRKIYNQKIESEYFRYEYPSSEDVRFYPCNDNSAYIMPVDGEYVVYKLTNDSIYASFEIDFGKYAISPQTADILNKSKERNAYFESDFYKRIFEVLETDDYVYFECIGPKARIYHALINKKTGKIKFGVWDYAKSPKFFYSDGVFLYGYYEPHTLIGRKNNGDNLNTCFDTVFDNLKDINIDENLVLVKVLLKDFS
jgi:hypothetical protein